MSLIGEKKIFYINSRRRSGGTDSDFHYVLDLPPKYSYDRVCVLQMMIPKSYYAIASGSNTFILEENGVQFTVTIDEGSYSRKSFQTRLQTLLNNAGNYTYSISYPTTSSNADTAKYTFTVSNNGGVQPKFIFSDNNVADAMGFARSSTNTFSGDSLTSSYVINLQKENTLFLHSDICSNSTDNVLQEVFAASGDPSFSNIHYECIDVEAYSKELTSNTTNSYRFYLSDEDGNKIDLQGQNMVITLLLYKKNTIYDMIKKFLKLNIFLQR